LLFLGASYCFVIYISYVHDVRDFEAAVFQPTLKQVLKKESAEVADVGEIVHGGSARVHSHFALVNGNKRFFLAC
jgi:hypothetical protein